MTYPPGLLVMNKSWQLEPSDLKALWFAVVRAKFTRAVQWRQALELMGSVHASQALHVSQALVERTCTRRAVLAMLEDLCLEGGLRRAQCSRIEEAILGTPQGAAECGECYAPDITVLASFGQPH